MRRQPVHKTNTTTTVESLEACLLLISTQDKKEFCEAYEKATHSNNGKSIWYYMQTRYRRLK